MLLYKQIKHVFLSVCEFCVHFDGVSSTKERNFVDFLCSGRPQLGFFFGFLDSLQMMTIIKTPSFI